MADKSREILAGVAAELLVSMVQGRADLKPGNVLRLAHTSFLLASELIWHCDEFGDKVITLVREKALQDLERSFMIRRTFRSRSTTP